MGDEIFDQDGPITAEVPLDAPPLFYLSEPCNELMAALAAAGGELTNPLKDSQAKIKMTNGGEYSYKYADLATTLAGLRPVLAKHGLALIQSPFVRSDGPCVLTTIAHKSGQRLMTRLDMPVSFTGSGKDAAKDLGSAITYLRRYAVTSAFPIASDEDSDIGNIQGHARPVAAQPKPAPRASAPPAARPTAAPAPSTPESDGAAWKERFRKTCQIERARLGDSLYFQTLGNYGFERGGDVPDDKTARKIEKELIERAENEFTNGHGVAVDDGDIPAELGGRS